MSAIHLFSLTEIFAAIGTISGIIICVWLSYFPNKNSLQRWFRDL